MSEPMASHNAVILILEQMRPGGLLDGFVLVAVRPNYNEYSGHMVDIKDMNDPGEQYYSVNTLDFVLPDVDWNQSPARLMNVLVDIRAKAPRGGRV